MEHGIDSQVFQVVLIIHNKHDLGLFVNVLVMIYWAHISITMDIIKCGPNTYLGFKYMGNPNKEKDATLNVTFVIW